MFLKRILGCLVALFLFSSLSAFAQNQSSISGDVKDGSGAAVAQATITLTSQSQGTVRTVQSNASGVYAFTFLPAGPYKIEVSAAGFKSLAVPDIILAVAQTERRDLTLEVGAVSENITVSGAQETLDTDNATTGSIINNKEVVEMPLNGRTFYSLASLSPGVNPAAQNSTNSTRGGFNVLGSCDVCNNYRLNGVFNNNVALGGIPSARPSVDSIQEFNILTGIYPAQYGYYSGGQIIVTTKSGTNQFHGSLFEFIRNEAANARNYFSAPGKLPEFRSNQFGGTFGGPIQKDKTFFFFSYEGLRLALVQPALVTYPTREEKNGDFSKVFLNPDGSIKPTLKNPVTGAFYPNNIITGALSPIGQALVNLYPDPTNPLPGIPNNNSSFQEPRRETYNSFSLKIDHTFSSRDSGFASANYYNDLSTEAGATLSAGCVPYYLPQFTCDSHQKAQVYGLSETHIFSTSLVNQATVGLDMQATESFPTQAHTNFWGQYGITTLITPTATTTRAPTYGYPSISPTGYTSYADGDINYYHIPTWDWTDALSWTHGKHTLTMGFNLLHAGANSINLGTPAGTLSFTNTSSGPTTGYALADMLVGYPAGSTLSPYKYQFYSRSASPSVYVQDDFKVSSSLTLNLGLRWETNTPIVDPANNLTSFDRVSGLPAVQANPAPIPAATAQPYVVLKTRSIWNSDFKDYSPRIGFAWQPLRDAKTVVRGGFGIFYNNSTNLLNSILNFPGGAPYTINASYTSSTSAPLLLSNPFPAGSATVAAPQLYGADPNYKNPRTYEWTIGAQRELTKDITLEVAYVGTAGRNLLGTQNINQPTPGPGGASVVQARRPYPNYANITYTEWGFFSNYGNGQVKVTKRYENGLSILGSYVYSHSSDNLGSASNAYDLRTATGPSNFDVRHRITVSAIWDLPFGAGRQFVTKGVLSQIIGGWQLSPLTQWQTGIPLTATLSGTFSNTAGTTTDRPNITGDPNKKAPHRPDAWFDTSVFQTTTAYNQPGATFSFGNEPRGVIRGPGLVNTDLQLSRTFRLSQGVNLQFRGEFFDLFNHPNFGIPSLVQNTASFGSITATVTPQNESGGANRTVQLAAKITF